MADNDRSCNIMPDENGPRAGVAASENAFHNQEDSQISESASQNA